RLVGADVPVEAALEITGLEEIVDPGLDILVEGVRIVRPMREEVAEVEAAGLEQMLGRRPARADAGIRAVEEEQATQALAMLSRQTLRDIGTDIMRDDS